MVSLIVIGLIYFYQNWFFFRYAEAILLKPVKRRWILLSFFINYALFTVCSVLQLHLVVNWLLIFILLFVEIRCFFQCSLSDSFILALFSMIIGLALNILFRCLLAAVTDLPLASFSNNTMEAGNLKRYPVALGFLAAGLYFHMAQRHEGQMSRPRVIFQDSARKRFLIQLSLAIYLFLVLNLLIYSEPGNYLVLKLWGAKSCVFSLIGLYLVMRYAARISRLSQYRALNREVLEALQRKRQEALELSRIASTDPLTGCPNRQMAETAIAEWLEAGQPFCLCFADLNGLKHVNDTQGHAMGDCYLLTVVQALQDACRQDMDQLFRYGGDEFLLLFPDLLPAIIGSRMQRVNRALRARSHMPGHPFDMSISYGLAQSSEYERADALIKAADRRMYTYKKTPKGINMEYDPKENNSIAGYEYNTLMSLMQVSVSKHLLDEHFTLVWANEFYYELIGWDKDAYEARYHNLCDTYYADDPGELAKLTAVVMDAIEGNKGGYTHISHMPKKGGEYVWVRMVATFADEYIDGHQVSYTVMTDINDLVLMQKAQTVTYNALPGFVAKFHIDKNFGLTLLEANERYTAFFGEGCQDTAANPLFLQNYDQNRQAIEASREKILSGQPISLTFTVKGVTGREARLQLNASCVDWQNQEPVYLAIFIDITDVTELREMQKQLEDQAAELKEALDAAEQASRAKSDFLSSMSHDIRTPMNAIVGMTEIARMHLGDPGRVENCLDKIALSSQHLLGLINDVLDMSAIESGSMALSNSAFSLPDFMENIVAIIQPAAAEKRQHLFIRTFGVEHEHLYADPLRLKQVFINILSNAVKFTPEEGSITLTLEEFPDAREGCGQFRFTFADTGMGMTDAFMAHIFDSFTRERDSRVDKTEGSGLGMAITKRIVDMMGGSITVRSAEGKGSTFVVYLSLHIEANPACYPALPPLRVLIADDDELMCEYAAQTLGALGIDAECAENGEDTVRRVISAHDAGQGFDVLILDWKMPGADGLEVTRQIRSRIGEELPILIASSYDWADIKKEAVSAGANDFISKPLFKSTLCHTLKRLIYGEKSPTTDKEKKPQYNFGGKRFLLVEDNALNQEIAVELLSQAGATVVCADDGAQGCEKFAQSPPGYYSLILMDVQMPVMNGYEATRKIRAMPRADARAVPIVAMTADAFAADIDKAREAGMDGHLAKPLDLPLMLQELNKLL